MVQLGLLWLLSAHKFLVCDIIHTIVWHFALLDELDFVGPLDTATYSVGQSSKLIGQQVQTIGQWSRQLYQGDQHNQVHPEEQSATQL